jgi:hypothetical protein
MQHPGISPSRYTVNGNVTVAWKYIFVQCIANNCMWIFSVQIPILFYFIHQLLKYFDKTTGSQNMFHKSVIHYQCHCHGSCTRCHIFINFTNRFLSFYHIFLFSGFVSVSVVSTIWCHGTSIRSVPCAVWSFRHLLWSTNTQNHRILVSDTRGLPLIILTHSYNWHIRHQ